MRKNVPVAILSLLLAALPLLCAAADPATPTRAAVLAHLDKMRAGERGMMNIAPAEGEYLSDLVVKLGAKRVLEIGTSNGYSGIWLALGLRQTGGKLITLDVDKGRRTLALQNFKATGMDDIVDSRLTDALKEIPQIEGPFDLVFIDAWKPDYIRYLKMVLPKVRSGGVITAHNVKSQASEMPDFLEAIQNSPELKTEFVNVGPSGLSVSYKK
jgi:caffeoyl-CoA O-methyltransferase